MTQKQETPFARAIAVITIAITIGAALLAAYTQLYLPRLREETEQHYERAALFWSPCEHEVKYTDDSHTRWYRHYCIGITNVGRATAENVRIVLTDQNAFENEWDGYIFPLRVDPPFDDIQLKVDDRNTRISLMVPSLASQGQVRIWVRAQVINGVDFGQEDPMDTYWCFQTPCPPTPTPFPRHMVRWLSGSDALEWVLGLSARCDNCGDGNINGAVVPWPAYLEPELQQ